MSGYRNSVSLSQQARSTGLKQIVFSALTGYLEWCEGRCDGAGTYSCFDAPSQSTNVQLETGKSRNPGSPSIFHEKYI